MVSKIVLDKSFEVGLIMLMTSTVVTALRALDNINNIEKLKLQLSTATTFIASCHYYLMISAPTKIISYRYLDWFFTTPLLLIDLCLTTGITDKRIISRLVAYNIVMLVFGFLGEIGVLNRTISCVIGFIPLALIFYDINRLMVRTTENIALLRVFIGVWSMYGILYMLDNQNMRNFTYNILDIIAKAGFGAYLYYRTYIN